MKEKIIKGLKWFYKSYIWLGLVLLGLDILTKQLIIHSDLIAGDKSSHYSLMNGFVYISYVQNEGAAFGMGTGNDMANRIIYLVVASLVSAGLITYLILKRKEAKLFIRASLIMVVVGAVGNMVDRIFYGPLQGYNGLFTGRVVDWIDFHWFWPYVFNIADCCIVIAAFMLIIYIIVLEVKDLIKRRNAEVAEFAQQKDLEKSNENAEDTPENTKEKESE